MNASAPAATTTYSGTSRFDVVPPAWIGTRNGTAATASGANQLGLRAITTAIAATTASASTIPTAANNG